MGSRCNYCPTELVLSGPLVEYLTIEMPAPKPKLMAVLNERLPIYEGKLHSVLRLGIKWSPPMLAPFFLH